MLVYRLTPKRFADDTSGEGARRKGGRWNPRGVPVHYTSSSASLAVLEFLIHVDPEDLPPVVLVTYEMPDALVEDYAGPLPKGWRKSPPPKKLVEIGGTWMKAGSALALRVPAVLFPDGPDTNILLNPRHSDFHKLKTISAVDFEFDQRLLEK
jgi:RES domain-containing protein